MPDNLKPSKKVKSANRLLAALPAAELAGLLAQTREVPLNFGQIIHEQNEAVRCLYFPVSGIISLLLAVEERSGSKSASSATKRFSANFLASGGIIAARSISLESRKRVLSRISSRLQKRDCGKKTLFIGGI